MAKLAEARKAAAPAKKAAAKPAPTDSTNGDDVDDNEAVLGEGMQTLVDQGVLVDDTKAPAKKTPAKKAAAVVKKTPTPTSKAAPTRTDPLESSVSLATVQEKVKALYYGPQGSGKTSDIATMANLSKAPTYIINAEAGLKASALRKLGIEVDRIQVLPDPESGIELTFSYLEDVWASAKARLEDDPESINGFSWDSVTEIHRKLLRNVVEEAGEKAAMKGKDRDPFFIDLADYGTMAEQVALLLRRYRDLPCHFAMTALERRDKDNDGKIVYNPGVTPALINPLVGWPDIVMCTSVVEVDGYEEYRGLSRPIDMYRGKDRFKVLPRRLIDPTFERVVAYVNEEMDLESDPIMQEALERRRGKKLREADDVGTEGDE